MQIIYVFFCLITYVINENGQIRELVSPIHPFGKV